MKAVRLQATVWDVDIPYLERFLNGIATEISFEPNYLDDLTEEDLKKIAIAKEESKLGLGIKSEKAHKMIRERRYGNRMDACIQQF